MWDIGANRDHPQALANYEARGMVVYKVEESVDYRTLQRWLLAPALFCDKVKP